MNEDVYISRVEISRPIPRNNYLYKLPLVRNLRKMGKLMIDTPVTFFVGENGMGKSTLIEAIAISVGFNPEGGTLNHSFSTKDSHSDLCNYITVSKTVRRWKHGFFLRAESFYNVSSYIEEIGSVAYFGGRSFHEQSHGESFLNLACTNFGSEGIYILDEPEAALSPMKIYAFMTVMSELIKHGSQFIISTHSPILLTFPGATIYELKEDAIEKTDYESTEHYTFTRAFLSNPKTFTKHLISSPDTE